MVDETCSEILQLHGDNDYFSRIKDMVASRHEEFNYSHMKKQKYNCSLSDSVISHVNAYVAYICIQMDLQFFFVLLR
jgi:hypothetical protein